MSERPLTPRDWLVALLVAVALLAAGWLFIVSASALAGTH